MNNNTSPVWKKRGTRQGLLRNALLKAMGYTDQDIEKPIIGVINTWAETNPGHVHFRQLSEAVKRGVWAAGGFPLEVNTMSICEVFFDLSSLIYRNLLSMTTEELTQASLLFTQLGTTLATIAALQGLQQENGETATTGQESQQ